MDRKSLLAQIHIGKKELGFDDELYRDFLSTTVNVTSCRDLDIPGLMKVIQAMQARGWKGGVRNPKKSSKAYVRKIFALWGEMVRTGAWKETSRASLVAFIKKTTGVDNPEWLTYPQASKVIEALKAIQMRAKDAPELPLGQVK